MTAIGMRRQIHPLGLAALGLVAAFACTVPAFAAADGLPRLDYTDGQSGTVYNVVMKGASVTLDPNLPSEPLVYRGTLALYQDLGEAEIRGGLELDLDDDLTPDRLLFCTGIVGRGRFALECSEDDGLGDFSFQTNGNAALLGTGRLGLRKATGVGFTDIARLRFVFQATEQ
jgi:hypothetical protein